MRPPVAGGGFAARLEPSPRRIFDGNIGSVIGVSVAMSSYDALVFDLDGTLWNATAASARGWNRAARAVGVDVELSEADIGRVCGLPFDRCVETLYPDLRPDARERLTPLLRASEAEVVRREGGRLYPGVTAGLRRLADRVPVLLLSNCDRDYLELFVAQAALGEVFHDTLCHGDTGLEKGDNLRRLRDQHGFTHPAYVGDTEGDRRACEAADFAFVYAAYGFGALDVDPAFGSFAALCAHLEERVAEIAPGT